MTPLARRTPGTLARARPRPSSPWPRRLRWASTARPRAGRPPRARSSATFTGEVVAAGPVYPAACGPRRRRPRRSSAPAWSARSVPSRRTCPSAPAFLVQLLVEGGRMNAFVSHHPGRRHARGAGARPCRRRARSAPRRHRSRPAGPPGRRRASRDLATLAGMSDRELADIGIDRASVPAVAAGTWLRDR
ncbi:MAG: DUF1127 domain-containing protein [Comamonadaceae bacterium]|nr:DUF1127 domain-containing protein [Comamonadaceae bacterium]